MTTLQNSVAIICGEEEDALDNVPDNLVDSDNASKLEENVDILSEICDDIEDIIEKLREVIE